MMRGCWKRWITVQVFMLLLLHPVSAGAQTEEPGTMSPLRYEIDVTPREDDHFRVRLRVDNLTDENRIYQFAATAPGTYQIMDVGRFVRNFTAFDGEGKALDCKKIGTNQWRLDHPELVREIHYEIADTWDTPVKKNEFYKMAGTSMEEDHVLFNAHCVIGFPHGMQGRPLWIKLHAPQDWQIGTPLERNEDGYFVAEDFDYAVDSPILLGRLSKAEMDIEGTHIEVYTYSKSGIAKSDEILDTIDELLVAASKFLKGLPVKRYTFLMHFEKETVGAWEHSYSSEYVFDEANYQALLYTMIPSVVAHEFFHILTPLHIHSQQIVPFDYENPKPNKHIWFYEGVTEWAAHMFPLRAGVSDLKTYVQDLMMKVMSQNFFYNDMSLVEMSERAHTTKGQLRFPNFYQKGALVAGLLDIRLLELSGGTKGLREVVLALAERFGPHKPFPEDGFFELFVAMTYPEIEDFIDRYIKNNQNLPLAEYYAKVGIIYHEKGENSGLFEIDPKPKAAAQKLRAAWVKNL